jgi:hypothetical protein
VQVKEGVTMPEFPELSIAGWTGTVLENTGSGSKLKVVLEWEAGALAAMPESYRRHCESQGLMFTMACLPGTDVDVSPE